MKGWTKPWSLRKRRCNSATQTTGPALSSGQITNGKLLIKPTVAAIPTPVAQSADVGQLFAESCNDQL